MRLSFWVRFVRFVALLPLALGLLSCSQTSGTTAADAQAFMDKAEAELMKLNVADNHSGWVHQTYINDDTDFLAAADEERLIGRTTELVKEAAKFDNLTLPPDLRRK